ncbi:MAG: hypothetical protein FD163_509 [Hyphomonadaceae bacterium]|nr:MAG: hypothetical protein FD163_509 [Hyphomonadaceae bacterium]
MNSGLSPQIKMLLTPMNSQNQPISPQAPSAAAKRALQEADERRQIQQSETLPLEIGGRKGQEPTRFGDWEKNGIAHDF